MPNRTRRRRSSQVLTTPEPVDVDMWRLCVSGRVAELLEFAYVDLTGRSEERALLRCRSRSYSEYAKQEIRVGDLLNGADGGGYAQWVQFRSVTGYR